jgi:NAD(P)-dependent dehydrogenase (short-subunit alcohol dehydrogenase family)
MQLRGARVLILGGSGLVGLAIARQLLPLRPAAVVISALTQREAETAVRELSREPVADGVQLAAEWGDVFVSDALKDRGREEILADAAARAALLDNLYGGVGEEAVDRSALGALLLRHRPEVVIDCINTATIFAYQNVFSSSADLRERARAGQVDLESVERHLATLYLPQLIHHVRVALEAMRRVETRIYIKIGTAGTGGMGLNVPFTHSEERPSRMLLAKSSLAGAHTLLLFLMARTPGAPAVKEIKPTAAISWKRIGAGEVQLGDRPIRRVDAVRPLPLEQAFAEPADDAWRDTGEALRGVFLDAGENGFFSPPEFEALTALGLMEFVTPEEIAQDVLREIQGFPTGRDVVSALDASTSGPTYRAGVLRQAVLSRMEALEAELGSPSIAYEMLGPPRLSKLLFEAAILGRLAGNDLVAAARLEPTDAACAAAQLIRDDDDLRTRILSIGLPILLPDGREIMRGAEVKVAPGDEGITDADRLAERGWVDLRAANWAQWRQRAQQILQRIDSMPGVEHGSQADVEAWHEARVIRPGALAAWVFRYQDGGERTRR